MLNDNASTCGQGEEKNALDSTHRSSHL
jgi:hypothetical protein